MTHYLFLDYETRSLLDLKEVGLDNYMKHEETQVLMLAWALDQGEIQLWQPHLDPLPPQELLAAWRDPSVVKIAWSAEFEFAATKRVIPRQCGFSIDCPLSEYRDPIVLAHNISLPGKLEKVGEILHMQQQKDARGSQLIKTFSEPVNRKQIGTPTLWGPTPPLYRDWNSHPEQWALFCEYCKQDVRTERDLWYRLAQMPFPEDDWAGWLLNEQINQFGLPTNRKRAEKMLRLAERYAREQKVALKAHTGLKNPNSDKQILAWVQERGYPWKSMLAKYAQAELDNPQSPITAECRIALEMRSRSRKASYKKLVRILSVLSDDDRLRYQFKYMAAARTGRWAGSDAQVQNLPRGSASVKKKLDLALALVDAEDYDGIVKEFSNADPKKSASVVEVVITLLRSLFEAKPGNILQVADLNAIENRVLGWVAGCKRILDVFRTCTECGYLDEATQGTFHCPKCGCHSARCPYINFGTQLYNRSYADMWHDYKVLGKKDERQNSKPPVLGAGYGLGGGEMQKNEFGDMVRGGLWGYAKNVCGVDMPQELAHKAVKIFRSSYPEVVQLWTDLEEAFKQVLVYGGTVEVGKVTWDKYEHEWAPHRTSLGCVIKFSRRKMAEGGWMIVVTLPSGRSLHYLNATLDHEEKVSKKPDPHTGEFRTYTVDVIHYDGVEHSASQDASGQTAKKHAKWGRVKTYGGKLTENIVQAIARDLLLHGMILANLLGFPIFGMFHDEIGTEVENTWDGLRVDDLVNCMSEVPAWAPGLLLGAEGYSSAYYKKE